MARRATETVQTNLRMKESLRRKLEREAQKRGHSFNREILWRIEESFEKDAQRGFSNIEQDMERSWIRFAHRFLLLELQEELAEALANSTDPKVANLASAWLKTKRSWPPKPKA
jgi:uncharacterized membrane protein YheB (UPF0754 family)